LIRSSNQVSEQLDLISNDIPFADIRKAVFHICNDNQQAILISDFESYGNGRFLDLEPYMSEPFKIWLERGYAIYIIVEPYIERYMGRNFNKKRFYMIFTDDKIEAPISHNMLNEIKTQIDNGRCDVFRLTNSDINIIRPKSEMIDGNLSFNVEYFPKFDYVTIDDSWESISQYVMNLDKYGQPMAGGVAVPLIRNLEIINGNNYSISDLQIIATNITAKYLSKDTSALEALKMDLQSIGKLEINISDGFILDSQAFERGKINVMLTEKIFSPGFLSSHLGGNLIRIDFAVENISLNTFDPSIFEWQSLFWTSQKAICVSKSIENALKDMNVVPTSKYRRVVHTIFLKTESYN
jgi:hypothetical protein